VAAFLLILTMRNITILTEGGENIGFGHLTRCLSLSQAFEARGYCPRFIVNGDNSVKSILKAGTFDVFNWAEEEERLLRVLKETDVAIVDSYLAGGGVYGKISDSVRVPVYLDDNRRIDYPPGIVVNWNIYAPGLGYPAKNGVSYLLGPEYVSLRKAFWDVPGKKIRETVTDVMVTFGGDDSRNITPMVMRFLAAGYPGLRKYIIVGSAFKNLSEIEDAVDDNTHLVRSPDAEGMKTVMSASDIAVTSGGQTLYELARMGVPAVALAVAENQRDNVEGWANRGFAKSAGYWTDDHLLVTIADRFKRLLPVSERTHSSETGRRVVPGNGAGKIIDIIETKFEREVPQ